MVKAHFRFNQAELPQLKSLIEPGDVKEPASFFRRYALAA